MAKGSFVFGVGEMYTTPNAKNPDPIKIGTPQGLSLSFSGDEASVFGNKRFAVARAGTTLDTTATITMGEFQPEFFSRYLFGATKGKGRHKQIEEVVILTDNSGTVSYVADDFDRNLGVIGKDGTRYALVETAPTEFQYTLDKTTGTYTFNAAAATKTVSIRYGQFFPNEGDQYVIKNSLMGSTPSFQLEVVGEFEGKGYCMIFPNVRAISYSMDSTNDGFTAPTLEVVMAVDDDDVLAYIENYDYEVE